MVFSLPLAVHAADCFAVIGMKSTNGAKTRHITCTLCSKLRC